MRARFTLIPLALVVAGCASARGAPDPYSQQTATDAAPAQVVFAAAQVFPQYGIPVDKADPETGTLTSGRFRVEATWNGFPVEDRIACEDAGTHARMWLRPIELIVSVGARPASTHEPRRSDVHGRTLVRLTGNVRMPEQQFRCTLAPRFARELLAAVLARAQG